MELSIIIVNWNVKDLLVKSLTSIFKYIQNVNFEVFVVDNNSHDGSIHLIQQKFPQVKLIQNKHNLGFAKANNQAIRQASGDYVLLLNPDTELIDSSLTEMLAFIKNKPVCTIVGPKLLHSDKTTQASLRKFPGFWDQFFILLKLHNFFPNLKPIKKYHMFDFNYDEIIQVEQIMGAAMLINKKVFDKIGLLDENMWLIFEEVDFCKRAIDVGCHIYFYAPTQIIHHKGESFSQHKALVKQINFNHNLFYYFRKHKPFYQFILLWLLQPFSLFLAWLDQLFNFKKIFGKNKNL